MKLSRAQQRTDPVARMVCDSTAEEFIEWLIEYHGLKGDPHGTLVLNLRQAFKWHRLQGRLDRSPFAVIIAEMLLMRRSVSTLDTPKKDQYDLVAHLSRQRAFSERVFGPGARTQGVVDHIRKELIEVEQAPQDLSEWIDIVLLALDGAWRAGHEPQAIAQALAAKQAKNEDRTWPDWRTSEPGKAIEHVRS